MSEVFFQENSPQKPNNQPFIFKRKIKAQIAPLQCYVCINSERR